MGFAPIVKVKTKKKQSKTKTMNQKEILNKTFEEMNHIFSSNEFSKKAQKNGLSKLEVNNGVIAYYLHQNAFQFKGRRMWSKKTTGNPIDNKTDKVNECISYLKSNGYKVFKVKVTTELVEVL